MPTKKTKNETIHAGKNEKKKKQIRTGGEGEIAGIVERKALDSAEHNAARQDARHEPMAQVKILKSHRL